MSVPSLSWQMIVSHHQEQCTAKLNRLLDPLLDVSAFVISSSPLLLTCPPQHFRDSSMRLADQEVQNALRPAQVACSSGSSSAALSASASPAATPSDPVRDQKRTFRVRFPCAFACFCVLSLSWQTQSCSRKREKRIFFCHCQNAGQCTALNIVDRTDLP